MIYDRYDLVLVLFPFTEKEGRKQRPAIILTDRTFHDEHKIATMLMVTTGSGTRWPSDLALEGFNDAGLRNPSFVRAKFFTAPIELLLKRLGCLTAGDSRRVGAWVQHLLAGTESMRQP